MLAPIEQFLFSALQFLYGWVSDYGAAIIILTIVIRLVLLPLTIKQNRSMYEMQRVQPKLKEIQQRYKDDKQKLQEEQMKVYQESKVNPFGGCLPMLIQMPIFFALFRMLGTVGDNPGLFPQYIAQLPVAEAAQASRFWVIFTDITDSASQVFAANGLLTALPYIIAVILFGLMTALPTIMQPAVQAQQKQMGIMMGAMMLFFGWTVSAGVLLYWVTQSVLGVVQQTAQTRMYKAHDAKVEAEKLAAAPSTKQSRKQARALEASATQATDEAKVKDTAQATEGQSPIVGKKNRQNRKPS